MSGEQVSVIGVSGRVGINGLARLLYPVERVADRLQRDLPAAQEAIEVQHHRLDVAVGSRRVDRPHHVPQPMLPRHRPAADRVEQPALRRLLDDRAVQIQHQRAGPGAAIGAVGQRRMQGREEQQHKQQDKPVLDADEQPPETGE
jgi:hypothetical protein